MKKYAIISSLSLAAVLLLAVTADVRAETMIPEDPAPDACALAEREGKNCDRWYEMGQPAPKVIVLHNIHFDVGSSNIRPESRRILDDNVSQLRGANKRIRIEGHTDSDGSDSYNQRLSEARANAVRSYFAGKGISSSNMTAVGRGENSPVATNATRAGKQQNRRIELYID